MKKTLLFFFLAISVSKVFSQTNFYFPPTTGTAWDTVSPTSLGWCTDKLDSVIDFAGQKNSKAFIILYKGKIAAEKYYGTFTKDSIWYWASAGKSLTAFLTGIAQEEGLLNIQDSVSKYLGTGWTSEPANKEAQIKIVHQLSMSTGLDYNVADLDCTDDTCLKYLADAGTGWYYHNAPYHLVQDVVAAASGVTFNSFTTSRVKTKIGMSGLWVDYVYYSRARDAARFGLLTLNHGIWSNDTILGDQNYFNAMVNSSQNMNLSYGYLWWLNGKNSFMAPGSTFVFPGSLCTTAPADMFSALGKNDQKIYVVPSMDLVVVRMGNPAGQVVLGPSSFDNDLWEKLMEVFNCNNVGIENLGMQSADLKIQPNPANEYLQVNVSTQLIGEKISVADVNGRVILKEQITQPVFSFSVSDFAKGIYFLKAGNAVKKFIVQ